MRKKLKLLFSLFTVFFRIGAFTFGGGYAMIPLISEETANKKKWVTECDILDIIAIAESTPGPISVNAATFIGHRVAGFWGAFFATFGLVLPSFIIILAISFVLEEFQSLKAVQYAFNGIRAGVLALIFKGFWSMYKQCPKNAISYILAALAFVCVAFLKINAIYCIIGCAVIGLVYSLIAQRRAEK